MDRPSFSPTSSPHRLRGRVARCAPAHYESRTLDA